MLTVDRLLAHNNAHLDTPKALVPCCFCKDSFRR
jgi:hypothetical protein